MQLYKLVYNLINASINIIIDSAKNFYLITLIKKLWFTNSIVQSIFGDAQYVY